MAGWIASSLMPKTAGASRPNDSVGALLAALFPGLGDNVMRSMHAAPAAAQGQTGKKTPKVDVALRGLEDKTLGSRAGTDLIGKSTLPKPGKTGTSVMPAWLQNDTNVLSGESNAFGGGSSDLLGLLAQVLGGVNKPAPVDPNQSELFRQQAQQVSLQNQAATAKRQGQIDWANLLNARNQIPTSNIGSLTYTGSDANRIDNQMWGLRQNGGYSTGWYGSMWPR